MAFLLKRGFKVHQPGVNAYLETSEYFRTAVALIWEERVPGWVDYGATLMDLGIATPEEISAACETESRQIVELFAKQMAERQLGHYGVAWLDAAGEFRHATFTLDGLVHWLEERGIKIDIKLVREAKLGDTLSFVTRHNLVIWRMSWAGH
ncbi:MAG: hypothetical protein ABIB97_03570 [Patescibacteria group bacterium]